MVANKYYLYDNNKQIAFSGSLEKLINKTTTTKDAVIKFNNIVVWVQNPSKYL